MLTFINIIKSLKEELPLHRATYCRWYYIDNNTNIQLKVTSPSICDGYADIVARITLYAYGQVMFDKYITVDTDLNKLYEKLKKKIRTVNLQERIDLSK